MAQVIIWDSVKNLNRITSPIKTIEIDFTNQATRSKTFQIVDLDVSSTSIIIPVHSAIAATGKSSDENEMDALICRAVASAGSFTLYVDSLFGPVRNKFNINYYIG